MLKVTLQKEKVYPGDSAIYTTNPWIIKAFLAWCDKWRVKDNPPTWEFPDIS